MKKLEKYRINNALKGKMNIERLIELYSSEYSSEILTITMIETNNHIVTVNWGLLKCLGSNTDRPYLNLIELFESYNIFDRVC